MAVEEMRIVIINDDPDDTALLRRSLQEESSQKFTFLEATSGEEGIRVCLSPELPRPDCVIVDLHLPDMGGLDLVRRLQDDDGETRVPIVLFIDTGNECKAATQALRSGAQDYIAKSWLTADGLACAVEHSIERFKVLERLRTERESLDRREREFKNLVDHLPDVVSRFDPEFKLVYINPAIVRISGLTPDHYLGRTTREAGLPDGYCDFLESLIKEVFAKGRELTFEFDFDTSRGKRCFRTRLLPEFSAQGEVATVLSVAIDVNEGKQVESALRTGKEHLRNVIDQMITFVGVLTPTGILIEANRLALDLAALKPSDVLNTPFDETYWWSYSTTVKADLRLAIECAGQGQLVRYDVPIRVADDHLITIDFMLAPLVDVNGIVTHIIASGVDITKRIESEHAAKEIATQAQVRSAELKTVLRATPAAIWIAKDPECRRITGNPASYKLLGLPEKTNVSASSTEVEREYRSFQEFRDGVLIPPDQLPMQLAAAHGIESLGTELSLRFKDGSERHIYGNATPLRTPDGNVYGAISAFIDITKLKQAEESARVNQERFELASGAVSGMLYDWDPLTGRIERSAGLFALTGYPPEEVNPDEEWWAGLIHPEDREVADQKLRETQSAQGPLHEMEYRVRHNDGSYRHVWDRARMVYDGQGRMTRVVGYTIDITERVKSEIIIRENEKKFRKFATSDIIGIAFGDVHGNLSYVNNEYLRIIGYTREEVEAGRLSWTEITPPEWVSKDEQSIAESKIRGSCTPYEKEYFRKDGTRVPVFVGFTLITESSDDFVAFILDATERKKSEKALKDADARKDEFLAMLAHELRNPLAAIRTAVQILRLKAPANPDLDWSRDVIDRQARHLTRLIEDLLDVSRISTGKIQLKRVPIDVRSVLTRAVDAAALVINAKNHHLEVRLPQEPLPTIADPVRLEQIVGNLLTNAAKYTDNGGSIILTGECDQESIVIRVQDNGIGISSEMLSQVFRLFAQAETSLDRSQGGLGIGLTLVKMLVELHGGSISAASAGPGQGSEFVIRIPIARSIPTIVESAAKSTLRQRELTSPPASRSRVLIVDDNVDIALGMATLIQNSGYEVHIVHEAQDALRLARDFRPSVVLTDIGLPGMNGYELAEAFRREEEFQKTTLIAISGYGQHQDRVRARDAGFNYHMIKPFELEALLEILALSAEDPRTPDIPDRK